MISDQSRWVGQKARKISEYHQSSMHTYEKVYQKTKMQFILLFEQFFTLYLKLSIEKSVTF